MVSDTTAFIGLAIDAALVAIFNRWYRRVSRQATEIKKAPNIAIGPELINELRTIDGHSIAYASVEGEVMPSRQSLHSHFHEGMSGVIQKISLVEHKSKRAQGFWTDVKNVIRDTLNCAPFYIQQVPTGSRKNNIQLHVDEPTEASFLLDDLCTTYDHFEPSKMSLMERTMDRIFGDVNKGLHETEQMLLTNTVILGIGEIALENGKLHLKPPSKGFQYILTTMSKHEVVKKLESKASWIKALRIISSIIGVGIIAYMIKKLYKRWQDDRQQEQFRAEIRSLREQRNQLADEDVNDNENSCVVCLNSPREIVLLNCGHICLCAECVLVLPTPLECPVCRQPVERYITTYHP